MFAVCRLIVRLVAFVAIAVACGWSSLRPLGAQDQQVVVDRNVHLRDQPSGSGNSIELLAPPTSLTLLDSTKTSGYFHVRDANGHDGWVWAKNVHVAAVPVAPSVHNTATSTLDPSWDKPPLVSTTWHGDEGDCIAQGDGQDDISTDTRKNRADSPTTSHAVAFAALTRANLPYPDAPKHRDNPGGWTAAQLAEIAQFEGEAVTVEGYIFVVRPQTSGTGEATNCHQHHAANTDVHIALTENFQQPEPTSVVVETTPRIRKDHPNWAASQLKSCCEGKNVLVRITGWTMLDPFHKADVAPTGIRRQTLWEIHPITKIEVFKAGTWVDLDGGGP